VTFVSQQQAVPCCSDHLSFPTRERERNKHRQILYRNKPELFNTFSDEKPLGKFSNEAQQKAGE